MPLDQPTATIIAASIAAALSAISAILAYRSAKAQHKVSKEALRAEVQDFPVEDRLIS